MKLCAVVVTLSIFLPLIFSADIWSSVPGTDDESKAANLFTGVITARNWLAGQLCTATYFQSPDPSDYTTNQNWGSFLCTQWGGPAGSFANCSYYYQNVRTNDSLQTNMNNLPGLMKSIHLYTGTSGYTLNDIQFNMTRDALVQAIYIAGSATQTFQIAAQNDLESLRTSIVSSSPVNCPTAKATINWKDPTTAGTTNVNPGDYVNWVWSDSDQHSVNYLTGGGTGFGFLGFGGDADALATGTICTSSLLADTSPCNLLGNGAFSYAVQFTTPCKTITYNCLIHTSAMTGTVVVGAATNQSCGTGSTTGYVGSTTTSTTTGGGSSETPTGSGSVLSSWMGLF